MSLPLNTPVPSRNHNWHFARPRMCTVNITAASKNAIEGKEKKAFVLMYINSKCQITITIALKNIKNLSRAYSETPTRRSNSLQDVMTIRLSIGIETTGIASGVINLGHISGYIRPQCTGMGKLE